jgi:hypothetical protein
MISIEGQSAAEPTPPADTASPTAARGRPPVRDRIEVFKVRLR